MKVDSMIKELISQGYVVTKPKAKLNLPEKVFNFFYAYKDMQQEHMLMCSMNTQMEVINTHVLTVGLVAGTLIDPREVYKRALQDNAHGIILCHNHPSGSIQPSAEDIETTKRIKEAGEIMRIELIDHVIVSFTGFNSLRESTTIW